MPFAKRCDQCPYGSGRAIGAIGSKKSPVVIIGEAPGAKELISGRPFIGSSGKLLWSTFEKLGIRHAEDKGYITNALQCRPPNGEPPSRTAIDACHDRLMAEIDAYPRQIIITMGNTSTQSLLGKKTPISKIRGRPIKREDGSIQMPTWHPAAILRNKGIHGPMYRQFCADIKLALDMAQGAEAMDPGETEYYDCQTHEEVTAAIDTILKCKYVAADIETGGLNPRRHRITCLGVSVEHGQTIIFPEQFIYDGSLKPLFDAPNLRWIWHNGKFDTQFLQTVGLNARLDDDTMLLHYALEESKGTHGLKDLSGEYLGAPDYDSDVKKLAKNVKKNGFAGVPTEQLYPYLAKDADYTRRLYRILWKQVHGDDSLDWLYHNLLLPASRFLQKVEQRGIYVDREALTFLRAELEPRRDAAIERCQAAAAPWWDAAMYVRDTGAKTEPKAFNVKSTPQLRWMTFDRLHLTVPADVLDKKTGKANTRKASLQKAIPAHEFVEGLLEFRDVSKTLSTYADGIEGRIDADERVHPTFLAHGTETGRLCVSADTLVEMPRDLVKYPNGVPITELKEGDLVYSFTWDKRLCLRHVKWVGKTGVKRTMKITARDEYTGEHVTVRITPEHLVRMFRGEWEHAGNLHVGARLMCMVRRNISEDYVTFFPSAKNRSKSNLDSTTSGKIKEHRWVYAQLNGLERLPSHWDVHHIDHNKLNNTPSNLEFMLHSSHMSMHRRAATLEEVQAMLDGTSPTRFHPETLRKLAKKFGLSPTNHTIVNIEAGPVEDVWDLEIEGTHTFVGNGVCLHNSASGPNTQNMDKRKIIKDIFAAPPGRTLIEVDMSQSELRVLASISRDDWMINVFRDHTRDLHWEMARAIFGVEATDAQRDYAKRLNFGIAYGMSAMLLSSMTGMSIQDAQHMIDAWFARCPRAKRFLDRCRYMATHGEYLETMFGRRRRFPEFLPVEALHGVENEAGNFPIQSISSDLVLLSAIRLDEILLARDVKICNLVHDSIMVEAPDEPDVIEWAVREMMQMMTAVPQEELGDLVPFIQEAKVGRNWGSTEKYHLPERDAVSV